MFTAEVNATAVVANVSKNKSFTRNQGAKLGYLTVP